MTLQMKLKWLFSLMYFVTKMASIETIFGMCLSCVFEKILEGEKFVLHLTSFCPDSIAFYFFMWKWFSLSKLRSSPKVLFHFKTNAIVNPASGTKLIMVTISPIKCIVELPTWFWHTTKRVGSGNGAQQYKYRHEISGKKHTTNFSSIN